MKQVGLNIQESKYRFFMDLIKSFSFVKVASEGEQQEDSKEQILKNIEQGFKEPKLYKEGKMKFTPLNDFINEL